MNLFELQENLKNFSQDQLVREMRNPTGTAPQYLVLSELQRRRRIMQEEQAQMPQQASVAEEAVAAAGMPQGGLAQMAQAMAPQTDMTQNTAAQPVERMSEGGLTGVSPRLTDFMPIGPSSRRASGRGIAITPMQMGQDIYEQYIEEMRRLERERRGSPEGLDLGMTADEVNRRANQGRYDPADASPPTVGARDIAALAGEEPIDLRGEVEFPTMGAGLTSLMNQAPSRELGNIIDGLAGSGVESRFDPTDELRTYMSPAERSRMMLSDPDIIERAAALDLTPEQYISSLSPARQDAALQAAVNRAAMPRAAEDRMMFGETPIGAIQSERTEEPMDETLRRILENSEAAIARESAIGVEPRAPDFVTAMPPAAARTMLPQPDLADDLRAARTADYNARTLAADAQRMGLDIPTRPGPMDDFSGRESARDRRIAASVRRSDLRERDDIARMFEEQALQDDANFTAEEMFQRGLGTTDFGPAIDALPADTGIRTNVSGPGTPEDIAETMDVGTPLEVGEGGVEALLPPLDLTRTSGDEDGAGGGAGGAGGTGGGAAAAQASSDDLYEQDKWLALAQFGLGLMSSQAPTLGQAIGEAGTTGIAALRQAREDRQDRLEAAQARADRLAAAAARGSNRGMTPDQIADNFRLQASAYRDIAQGILDTSLTGEIDGLTEDQQREYLEAISAADVLLRRSVDVSASGIAAAS